MLELLRENLASILIGLVLAAALTAAVAYMIRSRRKGAACSGCSGCPSAGRCRR